MSYCADGSNRKTDTREEAEIRNLLTFIASEIKNNRLVRFGLGLPSEKGIHLTSAMRALAMKHGLIVGADRITLEDARVMAATVIRVKDKLARMRKFGDPGKVRAFLHRILLPETRFIRDIIAGEDLWNETQTVLASAKGAQEAVNARIAGLSERLERLTGVSTKLVSDLIAKTEGELAEAKQRLKLLEDAGAPRTQLASARKQVADARQKLQNLRSGKIEDEKVAKAIKVQNALRNMFEGYYQVDTPSGTTLVELPTRKVTPDDNIEIVNPFQDAASAIKVKSGPKEILSEKAVALALKSAGIDPSENSYFREMFEEARDVINSHGAMIAQAAEAQRYNLAHQLSSSQGIEFEEAMDLARKAIKFEWKDLYFPRIAIEKLASYELMTNDIAESDAPLERLQAYINGDIAGVAPRSTAHTRQRTIASHGTDFSFDLIRSIGAYANEAIAYWQDNMFAYHINKHLRTLYDMRGRVPKESAEDFEAYLDSLSKYLMQYADRAKFNYSGGKLHKLQNLMISLRAAVTMGFKLSTPVLNMAEGRLLISLRTGYRAIGDAGFDKKFEQLQKYVGGAFSDIVAEELYDPRTRAGAKRIKDLIGPEAAKRYAAVEKDTADLLLERFGDVASKYTRVAITLQTDAENGNRRKAFKIGAVLEHEYLEEKFKPIFMDPERAKKLTIAEAKLLFGDEWEAARQILHEGTRKQRDALWDAFLTKRLTRAGYEMVYQTQWNYNMTNRSDFELGFTRMFAMYQHYPLSWLVSASRTYTVLKSLYEAGKMGGRGPLAGIAAMGSRSARDRSIWKTDKPWIKTLATGHVRKALTPHYWMGQEAAWALSLGMAIATYQAIQEETGFQLGSLLSHPLVEAFNEMRKFVVYAHEGQWWKTKTLMYGRGVLNEVTGPFYTDLSDAVSLLSIKAGLTTGDMPEALSSILRGTVGFNPDEVALSRNGRRKYTSLFDVVNSMFLWNATGIKPLWDEYHRMVDAGAAPSDIAARLGLKAVGIRNEKRIKAAITQKEYRRSSAYPRYMPF